MKTIKILGTGCANCVRLEANVKSALKKAWIEANIEKVTEIADIMAYQVMWTPGLVIDEKVVSAWKVLEIDEIISLLNWNKEEKTSCCSEKNTSCCSPKKEEIKEKSSCFSSKDNSCRSSSQSKEEWQICESKCFIIAWIKKILKLIFKK